METDVSQDVSIGDSHLPVPAIDTWGVWVLKGKNNHCDMGHDETKSVFGVSEKVRLKPVSSAIETS